MTNNNIFRQYGRPFQEKVVQAMLTDRKWASGFIEIFDVDDCLEQKDLKIIANQYIESYRKHKEFPTVEMFETFILNDVKALNDKTLETLCSAFFKRTKENKEIFDLPEVKSRAHLYCKQKTIQKALIDAQEFNLGEKFDSIPDLIKRAVISGEGHSRGLDYLNDIEARYSEEYRRTIKTGIPELDDKTILKGGLGGGEIGIICAPSGQGKSHILVQLGASAIEQGKNVLHLIFELNERMVGIRYDSHIMDIPFNECLTRKAEIKDFFEKNKENFGQLEIKKLKGDSTTSNTIRSYIEYLAAKEFRPDMLIVDYAGIMRSTKNYEQKRMVLEQVIIDLKSLCEDLDIPLWTALQSNKEGMKSDSIDMDNLAESFGQASHADLILGLLRPKKEKAIGLGKLSVIKNRFGMDGIVFDIHIDTAKSNISVLSKEETEEFRSEIDDKSANNNMDERQKRIKMALNKFKKDTRKDNLSYISLRKEGTNDE